MEWKDVPSRVMCRLLEACNGRTIFSPEDLAKGGVPRELIDRAVAFHSSDFLTSTTLLIRHEDSKLVGALTGVLDLDLLYQIAQGLGVRHERTGDSGAQAQVLIEAIEGYYIARARLPQAEILTDRYVPRERPLAPVSPR